MKSLTETIILGLALLGIAMLVQAALGCSGTQKSVEAEAAYLGQQLDCVEAFPTKPEIDACRAKVRAQWGVTDAGKDGDR